MATTENAATQLAALLQTYTVPKSSTPEEHRGFSGDTDLNAWRRHNAACDLVRSVDHILIGMEASGEDVDHFLAVLPAWYSAVHFASTPWGSRQTVGSRAATDPSSISMLMALGSVLRAQGFLTIDEDARRRLTDTLQQAREIIENDIDTFTPDVRHYLLALLHRAEIVAEQVDTYGAERVREVALELGGVVHVQADAVEADNPEKASRLRAIGTMLVGGFLARYGEHAADALNSAAETAVKSISN